MGKAQASADPEAHDHPYDADVFAEKYGLTQKAAEVILFSNGPSKIACDAAARAFRAAVAMRSNRQRDH
ncbi:hypothetical protein OHD62_19270 [Mesorhizobium sp. YC-39]|uniref:hypothetical protein n=1 Tax=unclassified Mesorhizobium TaxID=325217 RepID=UPI0021E7DB61|nr:MULTISPECIES: hypothetical protein [unclassified Mesorhizobium]MCV3209985.1 hypothetical protein [Mesorhizobium sp. YC-2]MCV3230515.1 hypothetical protein [Mesorhizobium sp. YC-39]